MMNKSIALAGAALAVLLAACERRDEAASGEGPMEQAGQAADAAAAKAGEALNSAGEKAGELMQQGGEKLENAANEAKQ